MIKITLLAKLPMELFLHEYFYFVSAIAAILVSVASSSLFFMASQYERKLRSTKRAFGFAILALAFLAAILERKNEIFGLATVILEVVGFALICLGVIAEPGLSHLTIRQKAREKGNTPTMARKDIMQLILAILGLILITLILSTINITYFRDTPLEGYLKSFLQFVAGIFILITIFYQIRRYLAERSDAQTRLQNLYPLLGYIFLLVRSVSVTLFRLPELDVVAVRLLVLEYSFIWKIAYYCAFVGFVFLGIWAWNFIKIRYFLRVYVVFLAIGIIMASLGSLIVLLLNFRIIEANNLQRLDNHAQAIDVVMEERLKTSNLISKLISKNSSLLEQVQDGDLDLLEDETEEYIEEADLDIIRVYSPFGKIVASPHEPRDVGANRINDPLVKYTLENNEPAQSYDRDPGVLTPTITARGIYPILGDSAANGLVEVGYKFDTPFVDFLSRKTSYDITIFTAATRSATTISTSDGVSRWVGTQETNGDVLDAVLGNGEKYQGVTVGLDNIVNYSAYSPVMDFEGVIIGMISAESSTQILFEDTRQQLITSFLLVGAVSLVTTLIGYYAIKSYEFDSDVNIRP
jgi:hypothetical protein